MSQKREKFYCLLKGFLRVFVVLVYEYSARLNKLWNDELERIFRLFDEMNSNYRTNPESQLEFLLGLYRFESKDVEIVTQILDKSQDKVSRMLEENEIPGIHILLTVNNAVQVQINNFPLPYKNAHCDEVASWAREYSSLRNAFIKLVEGFGKDNLSTKQIALELQDLKDQY